MLSILKKVTGLVGKRTAEICKRENWNMEQFYALFENGELMFLPGKNV